MSRVGKYPVIIPNGVNVAINGNVVKASGKLGELSFAYDDSHVVAKLENNTVVVTPLSTSKQARTLCGTTRARTNTMVHVTRDNEVKSTKAAHGLYRALIATMVKGVSEGFTKEMELIGVGYKARVEGTKKLVLSLGFSHDIDFAIPEGIKITCASPTQISVFGADKQLVGQVASEIRDYRSPEPYKGKGVRYVGEYVRRKEGKKK